MIQTSQLVQYLLVTALVAGLLVYVPVKLTVRQILEKLDASHRVAAEARSTADRASRNVALINDRYLELKDRVDEIEKHCPACPVEAPR
jgi:hypothetical protein